MVWQAVATITVEAAQAHSDRDPEWLPGACGLSSDALAPLLPFYLPLAVQIAERRRASGGPIVIGIQGPQGSGKSTLVALLQAVLRDVAGLKTVCLSIDDLYLTRSERAELAAQVHPLFATRGVPGTHDVELGTRVLASLTKAGSTAVPRFDKGLDDRLPEHAWPKVEGPCDVVLFEGLWIGLPPIADDELATPVNALERDEDPAGAWRRHANRALAEQYPPLFAPCSWLIHFAVPDFSCVRTWRSGAEHALRARLEQEGRDTSLVMDDHGLQRFFAHYERFTAHAVASMPSRADVILRVDREHRVVASEAPGER